MNTFSTSLEASESRPKAVAIITARGGSKRIPQKRTGFLRKTHYQLFPPGCSCFRGF